MKFKTRFSQTALKVDKHDEERMPKIFAELVKRRNFFAKKTGQKLFKNCL